MDVVVKVSITVGQLKLFQHFSLDFNLIPPLVQVQHPGIEKLMMTDIRNLQLFALYVQRTDIKFDLYSITKEMETQVTYHSGSLLTQLDKTSLVQVTRTSIYVCVFSRLVMNLTSKERPMQWKEFDIFYMRTTRSLLLQFQGHCEIR